jgi:hypothetical protein
MQLLEISWDLEILGFSKILGFFQRFFGIFDEVYEDFQSNLPLAVHNHQWLLRLLRGPKALHFPTGTLPEMKVVDSPSSRL